MGQLSDGSKDPGCINGTSGREVDREGCVGVGESDTATVSVFLKTKDTEVWGVGRPVVGGGRGRERRLSSSTSNGRSEAEHQNWGATYVAAQPGL